MISGRKGARRLGKLPAALPNLEKSGLHIRRIHTALRLLSVSQKPNGRLAMVEGSGHEFVQNQSFLLPVTQVYEESMTPSVTDSMGQLPPLTGGGVVYFKIRVLRKFLVAFLAVLGGASPLWAMDLGELAFGRWALLFVVIPGCPACEKVLPWFSRAAQAFPEIRFLVVAPEVTPELAGLAGELPVYIDEGGTLGLELGITRAPTVLLSVEGVIINQLNWPFTEGQLFRSLAESLLVEIRLPSPRELLGQPAPEFTAVDLNGEEISFSGLPRPVLLVFFDPGCPPCWEILPLLGELSQNVAIILIVAAKEARISEVDRRRLMEFVKEAEEQGGSAFVVLDLWVKGKGFTILQAYTVGRSPTYILIDGKGVIVGVWEGKVEEEKLVEEVRSVLAEAG